MVGALLAIAAAILFGSALAIQKYAAGEMTLFSFTQLVRNRIWLFSILVGAVGIVAYLIALRLTSLTAVQPLMAFSLVIPLLAGIAFFKEQLEVSEWLLLAVFLVGIGLVSLS